VELKMKLFHQLEEFEQEEVIFHFVFDIAHRFLEKGLDFEPLEHTEPEIKELLKQSLDNALKFNEHEEQVDYLLDDEEFCSMAYSVAGDMAVRSFYAEDTDMVIKLDEVVNYELEEESENKESKEIKRVVKDKSLN
jgi:hypothetical protein